MTRSPAALALLAILAGCASAKPEAGVPAAVVATERWARPAGATVYVATQYDDRQLQPAEFRLCDPGQAACPLFSRKIYESSRQIDSSARTHAGLVTHRVFFPFASSKLDADATATLEELLPRARSAHLVLIEGRTDPRGPKQTNERLALARAEAVRNALVARGVPQDRITTRSAQPCCDGPIPSTESDYAQRRRADVSISIAPKRPLNG